MYDLTFHEKRKLVVVKRKAFCPYNSKPYNSKEA